MNLLQSISTLFNENFDDVMDDIVKHTEIEDSRSSDVLKELLTIEMFFTLMELVSKPTQKGDSSSIGLFTTVPFELRDNTLMLTIGAIIECDASKTMNELYEELNTLKDNAVWSIVNTRSHVTDMTFGTIKLSLLTNNSDMVLFETPNENNDGHVLEVTSDKYQKQRINPNIHEHMRKAEGKAARFNAQPLSQRKKIIADNYFVRLVNTSIDIPLSDDEILTLYKSLCDDFQSGLTIGTDYYFYYSDTLSTSDPAVVMENLKDSLENSPHPYESLIEYYRIRLPSEPFNKLAKILEIREPNNE